MRIQQKVWQKDRKQQTLHLTQYGNVPRVNGITTKFLKKRSDSTEDRLVRLFNDCMAKGEKTEDWHNKCIVLSIKAKRTKVNV